MITTILFLAMLLLISCNDDVLNLVQEGAAHDSLRPENFRS